MPSDLPHASDRTERQPSVEAPAQSPLVEQSSDRPAAKPAFESADTALVERKAADTEAEAETDRPDWPPDERRSAEPTTELVRTEGDLRYELDTPADLPEVFEREDESWVGRLRDKMTKPEMVENIDGAGTELTRLLEGLVGDRPRPSGAYVGTPDHPVIKQAPREAVDGGALAIAPIVLWVAADRLVRWVRETYGEWKQSRGDRDDADH